MLGGDDDVDATGITDSAALQAFGGAGGDEMDGGPNGDTINGEDGDDALWGYEGNDVLDGGGANDYLRDGPGNDTLTGGTGDDTMVAGPGADSFTGGDGADGADYRDRSASVTITLLGGVADDGEAGEGDFIAADVESAFGGSGNDTIRGNDLGGYLIGGSGNDTITAGKAEDRVEGNEGDDVIDTRDGRYDSIDCGPGNDTLFADPGDGAVNCEIAPDPDGDGSLAPADCAPTDPAIHPGAGEIVGNTVDEDCAAGPLYLRVIAPVSFRTKSPQEPGERPLRPAHRLRGPRRRQGRGPLHGRQEEGLPVLEEDRHRQGRQADGGRRQAAQEALPRQGRGARPAGAAHERDRPRAALHGRAQGRGQERTAVPERGRDEAHQVHLGRTRSRSAPPSSRRRRRRC